MSAEFPATESIDAATRDLDLLTTPELVAALSGAHRRSVEAVIGARDALALAVDTIVARLAAGGGLHYVGAGTSGRLGVLDAAECPPTFGTHPDLVRAHIAGGHTALVRALEGVEDDADAGRAAIADAVRSGDVVVGISASGGAAYVVAALTLARERGAATIAITSEAASPLARAAQAAIVLTTGAEPLTGSTRLVAGTAQKIALGVLSTSVMVRLGRVYDNLMVDLVATNAKLRRRALRIVGVLTGLDDVRGAEILESSGGNVKVAVVAARRNLPPDDARAALAAAGGSLREVLNADR